MILQNNLIRKLYLISLFTNIGINTNSQTCIIAKKTKEAIFVGADSRGTPYSYNPITNTVIKDTSSTLCKIYAAGKFNFAISGIAFPIAMEEGKKAIFNKQNFWEVLNAFVPSFGRRLQDTLEKYRKEMPTVFSSVIPTSKTLSRVIFFGIEDDSLYMSQADFFLESDLNDSVIISAKGGQSDIIVAGHAEEIKDTVFKKNAWKNGPVSTIKALIKIEINARKLEVGGPIDLIKVTKKGIFWIQRKKICTQ